MGVTEVALGVAIFSAVASAGSAAYNTQAASSEAKKKERLQKSQLALQKRTAEIKAKREARIKAATFLASAGSAGMSGDIVSGTLTGIESSLKGGLETMESQNTLQLAEITRERKTTIDNAFFDFGSSIIGAASDTSKASSDYLSDPNRKYFLD